MVSRRLRSQRFWTIVRIIGTVVGFVLNGALWLFSKILGGIGGIQAAQGANATFKSVATWVQIVPSEVYAVVGLACLATFIWLLVRDAGSGTAALEKAWEFRDGFEAFKEKTNTQFEGISVGLNGMTEQLGKLSEAMDGVSARITGQEEALATYIKNMGPETDRFLTMMGTFTEGLRTQLHEEATVQHRAFMDQLGLLNDKWAAETQERANHADSLVMQLRDELRVNDLLRDPE